MNQDKYIGTDVHQATISVAWNRLDAVQIEDQAFEGKAVVFLSLYQRGRRRPVLPWEIAQQAPKFLAAALLI